MFKSIEKNVSAEIIEKKSKFIANIYPINNKDDAQQIIKNIKKKYYDSKHNCYAYIVDNFEKCSDDGEPSGTAGAPLLDLLKNKELNNVLVIVTRYFGGILLGTGGLVRAYTDSAKKALENANILHKEYGIEYKVEISYSNFQEFMYLCKKIDINIVNIKYEENIIVTLKSNIEKKNNLCQKIKILNCEVIKENILI